MNFGYLIFSSKNESVDYNRLAYSLALSIKNTQKHGYNNVCLVTDNVEGLEQLKSPWVFDKVVEWDLKKGWDGRSWMDQLTPFEYTVCLDADMLFTRDISHQIDFFIENVELYIPSKAYTYRGDVVTGDFYRKVFTYNELPNLYSFFTFFKSDSLLAKEFFKLGRYIMTDPKEFSNSFFPDFKPKILGTDEAFSLSAKILDIADEISFDLSFPKVVHLKPMIQDWPWPADSWSDHIGFYFNTHNQIKIGNHQQTDILHYVEKNKITDEIISLQEELLWQK
jgi:hypothetical protein